MPEVGSFSAEALKDARIARGLNQTELADAIKVTRQAISKLEQGESKPSPETFEKLLTVLALPPRFFLKHSPFAYAKNTPTFHRKLKAASLYERDKASKRAEWAYRAFDYLNKFINRAPVSLPDFISRPGYDFLKITDEELEGYAEELRKFWGLGPGPISKLIPLLEKNGIIVAQFEMPHEIKAFSHFIERNPVIIGSSNATATMHRHNLSHECAHLVLHKHIDQFEYELNLDIIERQAERFAGAFLFPRKPFCEEFYSTNINYLATLKRRWGVSISSIIYRATQLGIITQEEQTNIRRRHHGLRSKEPLDDQIEIEKPSLLPNGLKAVIESKYSTIEDVKYAIPINEIDLAEVFCVEPNYFAPERLGNTIEFRPRSKQEGLR